MPEKRATAGLAAARAAKSGQSRRISLTVVLTCLLVVLLTGCSAPRSIATQAPTGKAPTPSESAPPPTSTATATPTATSTATPHPLTIQHLRDGEYPGSEIVIHDTLEPGANYNRYLASYASEGLRIYALLTVPFGEPPLEGWPAIVFNHGYLPPEQYRTTERYVDYVDGFARSGYIVLRPDYRGHGESEGIARGGYSVPDYTIDVLNALGSLRRYPPADQNRLGMWGHSMGGYITLRAMVAADDIRAGVIWAGVVASYTDLLARWHRGRDTGPGTPTPRPRGWRRGLIEIYGPPEENPDFWHSISANNYLADLSGPVQLHHGTADDSVPIEFSQRLFDQIQQAGGATELYEYPGDNHNISRYFTQAMQRSIRFFDRYLKNAGDG